MAYVVLACRALVGLVFLSALVSKVRSRSQRAAFVAATGRLAPGWLIRRVPSRRLAAGTVAAEAGVVVLLTVPATVPWGFVLAALLALVLTAAIGAALRRGERGSCNCFGASTRPLSTWQLVRNLVLAAGAGLGYATVTVASAPIEWGGAVVALVAGGVAAVLLVAADDIVDLFRPIAGPHRTPSR